MKMLSQVFSSQDKFNAIDNSNSTKRKGTTMKNVSTLTKNLFIGALMLLLLTAGMVLITPQDAHAQVKVTVNFSEPTGTQKTKTFKVPVTLNLAASAGPGQGGAFAPADISVSTTRTQGSGDATVVAVLGSGKNYDVEIKPPSNAKGSITFTVKKDSISAFHSSEGTVWGPSSDKTSNSISFDTTNLLRVNFTEPTGVQTSSTFTVPITFSHTNVTGFTAADITVATTRTSGSGDATVSLSGSGSSYTATVTPPSDAKGSVTLTIKKDSVTFNTNVNGPSTEETSKSINFDTLVPTVTYTEPAGTQEGATFDVPITINKSVTGFEDSDITVTSSTGTATATLNGSGTSYTATVTSPTNATGTITLEVAAGAVTDGTRTGPASKATSSAISFDTTPATVTFTEPAGTQTANSFTVPITFSKSVTGFAASDITVTTTRTSGTGNATVSLSGSGTSWTATVTSPTAAKGTITLQVDANSVNDGTRNAPASNTTSSVINFDTTVATVSFTEPAGTQSGNTFDVPITFSKSVTGFAASDITVTSSTGTASVSLSGSGTSYTATVTPPTTTSGTITLEVAKDAVTDGTRPGPASKATSNGIAFDTTPATVSFTEPAGTQAGTTFDVPITFSKSVTGFAANDITVTTTLTSGTGNATVTVNGSGTSWTATVTSPTTAKGTITLEVKKDAVTDGTRTGPASAATSDAMSFDTTPATVDFTEPTGGQATDFDVPITFSKSVTGFTTADITITTTRTSGTGDATFTLSGSGKDYTATITVPTDAVGTITLQVAADSVSDGTRTGPSSQTASDAISFDTNPPMANFSEPAGIQYEDTFDVAIEFGKSVTGFAADDITITTTLTSGTGNATFTFRGSGSDYSVAVTPPAESKGTITLQIAKNAVTDSVSRTGPVSATTSESISFDNTTPSVTYTVPQGVQVTNFDVPIKFSKFILEFYLSDLTLTTTRTSGTGDATFRVPGVGGDVGSSGTDFTAKITLPANAAGTVNLSMKADAVEDTGEHKGPASATATGNISFDTRVPTVSFTEPAGTQYGNTFDVPITISKSVTGFAASDITVTSSTGTASVALSGSGTSYTATVTSPTAAKGTITLEVAKDAVTDGTRTGPASKATSSAINFDTTVPTVTFTEPAGIQVGDSFTVPITINKSVTGLAESDITITTTRTSGTGNATVALSGSGASYTATVTSPTAAKGTITLEVAKDSVTDGTRTGPASKATSSAISFDTTVATVSFTEPAGTQVSDTFDVPITFSKSVTGFATSDITLTSSTGTASVSLSGSGTSYTATVTSPTAAQGTITLEVAKDAVTDGTRTAPASKATSSAISFDTTVATVSFDEPNGVQTSNNFDVGIDFSKSVTGFTASDITLTTTLTSGSGTPTVSLSGSGSAYTATITSLTTAKGTIVLEVAKDAVTDGTRTAPDSKAVSAAIAFDTTAPTVTFSEPQGTQTADTFTVGINFSKSVTGFEASDLTITTTRTNGTGNASFTLSGSGSSYTATVTSPTEAKGTVKFEIAKDAATDGTKQVPKNRQTSKNIGFDTTTPVVTYNEPQGTQIANTFDVGIVFSKSVTGFEAGDIRLVTTHKVGTDGTGNATLTLKGSGTHYTARISLPRLAIGTVRLTIAANAATDGTRTGPANELIGSAIAFDTTVATVSFTEPAGVQTLGTFNVPITFSKSVTGFNTVNNPHNRAGVVSDLMVTTIVGSIRSENIKVILIGSGADYVASITIPTAAKGTIILEVARGAATDGTRPAPAQKTTSNAIAFDTTSTTVSFSEPAGNPQRTDTFNVGITFSRSVTGFEAGDIKIKTKYNSGSGNATFTLSGSDSDYTAAITVPSDAIGTLTLEVAANAATDGTRTTPANKATSKAIAFDTTTPTVSFTVPSDTQTSAFDVGITFSRSVTGFVVGDVTLTTTRTSGTGDATFTLAGSGTSYTATITPPIDAIGNVTLTVKANAATDGVRNGPTADKSVSVNFDTQVSTPPLNLDPIHTPPIDTNPATIVFSEPSGTQRADTFDVGITFSKSVTGFEASDITLTTTHTTSTGEGTASVSLSGSGTAYTATITSPTDAKGNVTLAVAANAANDGTHDVPTTAQTSASIAFDTTLPTVSFTVPQGVQASPFDVGITFSKSITGFEISDMTLTTTRTSGTGDATFTLAGSGTDYTVTITPPADAAGDIALTVKANTATDGVRNGPVRDTSVQINFGTQVNTPPVNTDLNNTPPVNSSDDTDNTDTSDDTDDTNTSDDTDDTDTSDDTGNINNSDISHLGKVIFNEIYNGTVNKNDWIELKNVGDYTINLEDWEIGIVTGNGATVQEKKIATLPKYELYPNHILLIVNTAPSENDIAPGIDIYDGRPDEEGLESWNVSRYLRVEKLKLPVAEKFLLTLRQEKDKTGTSEAIVDIASTYWPNNLDWDETLLWPLQIVKPTGLAPVLAPDAAWRRIYKETETRGYIAAAWTASGYQDGRGYDKDAPKATSLGTPGHLNDYPLATNLPSGPVAISEIMFATRNSRRAVSQWIEFYNTSTKIVDLRGWQLNLEMRSETNISKNKTLTFTFEGVHVGPKQTLLIVTQEGSNSGHFPEHKVYDLSVQQKDMPGASELLNANRYLLSSAGFSLMLSDANGKVVDKIGNLDGDPKTVDAPKWKLPSGKTAAGQRSSLLRQYKDGEPLVGTELSGWRAAKNLQLSFRTYWGHSTDIGNPGYRQGGYLPVSLSQFDAVLTGTEVVLKWTTASELDNAGFNIYRSESLKGEFKQINAELIQGAGTTGERQQYEWKDTTAKPNVSYYYRIEDVSFSGVQEQLQTVRMRGHVSASGKELCTWASLKSNR